ncbi:hypothetical protein H311_00627 [Anncaliia algerae PRA109]|nr:hypothetical protein H311_00627 [Anncaliia algerae PRA109]
MLNFKNRSYHERSSSNRTEALSITEFDGKVTRAFAKIILNIEAATILPIISSQVLHNSKFTQIYIKVTQNYQAWGLIMIYVPQILFVDNISGTTLKELKALKMN